MSDGGDRFWQQYQHNLREYNRQAPRRFLRLVVAFGITLVLAPCCMVVANVTGEPLAAMGVALVGLVLAVVVWKVLWWVFDRPSPLPPISMSPFGAPSATMATVSGQSPYHQPYQTPGSGPAQADAQPQTHSFIKPTMSAATGPVPPFTKEPPSNGSGCVIALLAIGGLSVLVCCGGGVAMMAFLPKLKFQGPQNAVRQGPPPFAFGPGGGNPFPGGHAFPGGDPFAEINRQHQQHLDDVLQQHRDLMRQHEQQMREFDRQMEQQNNQLFQPDF